MRVTTIASHIRNKVTGFRQDIDKRRNAVFLPFSLFDKDIVLELKKKFFCHFFKVDIKTVSMNVF